MLYELRNNDGQLVRFEGDVLGSDSSESFARSQGRLRWHEVRIYKTIRGQYVVEKVGMSDVPGEVERRTVHVSDTPRGVVECLSSQDEDGVSYMTYVSRAACRRAGLADAGIAQAYNVVDLTA